MHLSDVKNGVNIFWIKNLGLLVMFHRARKVVMIIECASQVKVALRTCRIQFNGQLIGMNSLLVLLGHVVSVTKVVESWIMLRVKANRFQIEVDSIHKLALVAECISQIIIALNFLRVDL